MMSPMIGGLQKTTNYKVVLPFYVYAAFGFLLATLLLMRHTEAVGGHHFNPYLLAVTHTMALAWGTMIIYGASHQLLPVMVEGKLDSDLLAYLTFGFNALGIPFLVYGFYVFDMGLPLQIGAVLINLGVVCYLANVLASSFRKRKINVHAWFVVSSTIWLFFTTLLGLLLVFNFTVPMLKADSLEYLSLHAHLGIVGWFVLMVIGVGSRLIPMFLISKYTNEKILWWIFALMNGGLIAFSLLFLLDSPSYLFYLPVVMGLIAIVLFGKHCYEAYRIRIRKQVDQQVKTSLISVAQMLIPILTLLLVVALIPLGTSYPVISLYGFSIFFGWITAIILGMTFKTLPFIVWNKVYSNRANKGATPAPKELFNEKVYQIMLISYLVGFVVFALGIILKSLITLNIGVFALLLAAILYVYNVIITVNHRSK